MSVNKKHMISLEEIRIKDEKGRKSDRKWFGKEGMEEGTRVAVPQGCLSHGQET